jgi:hypothetical protein
MFLSNVVVGWAALEIVRASARRQRKEIEAPAPTASP